MQPKVVSSPDSSTMSRKSKLTLDITVGLFPSILSDYISPSITYSTKLSILQILYMINVPFLSACYFFVLEKPIRVPELIALKALIVLLLLCMSYILATLTVSKHSKVVYHKISLSM